MEELFLIVFFFGFSIPYLGLSVAMFRDKDKIGGVFMLFAWLFLIVAPILIEIFNL